MSSVTCIGINNLRARMPLFQKEGGFKIYSGEGVGTVVQIIFLKQELDDIKESKRHV